MFLLCSVVYRACIEYTVLVLVFGYHICYFKSVSKYWLSNETTFKFLCFWAPAETNNGDTTEPNGRLTNIFERVLLLIKNWSLRLLKHILQKPILMVEPVLAKIPETFWTNYVHQISIDQNHIEQSISHLCAFMYNKIDCILSHKIGIYTSVFRNQFHLKVILKRINHQNAKLIKYSRIDARCTQENSITQCAFMHLPTFPWCDKIPLCTLFCKENYSSCT